jgi:hypothetical protein
MLSNQNKLRLKQNPYHLLLLTGFALILTTFLLPQNKTVDIHFHDTYYIIAQVQLHYLFAGIIWLLWLLYLPTRKVLHSISLTWAHVIITLLSIMMLLFLLNFDGLIFNSSPGREMDHGLWKTFNRYDRNFKWAGLALSSLLPGQILFVINLVLGIFKRRS